MANGIEVDMRQLDNFHNRMRRFVPVFKQRHASMMEQLAREFQRRVQQNASGRPGPNVITGAYRASIQAAKVDEEAWHIFTDAPQGARLEFGYVGLDSLGRHYHQPPFPHFRTAAEEMRPVLAKAQLELPAVVWRQV